MTESKTKTIPELHCNGVSWLCLQKSSKTAFDELQKEYNLHPVHLKESVQTIQLTQVEREEHYIFLLVHLPTFDVAHNRIKTSQVGIFLGRDFVITVHDGQKSAVTALFDACLADTVLAEECTGQSTGFLLYSILKRLLEDVSKTTETLLNELDAVETLVFDNNKSDAYEIGKLRQKIIRLKRVVGPLQSVLADLAEQINDFTGEHLNKYYSNNAKLAHKLTEVIGEAQETIEIFKDADFTTSTEQTNQILAVLTLVFTFTIPVTVLGTLYGMNVPLPGGLSNGAWTFFGTYTTLGLIIAASVVMVGIMYAFFKNKRWF